MEKNNGHIRLVAALLFLALCAYIGAAMWEHTGGDVSVVTARASVVTESVPLRGIAVRTEQSIELDAENGERLPADGRHPAGVWFAESDGYEHLSPAMLSEPRSVLEAGAGEHTGGRLVTENVWYFVAECKTELVCGEKYAILFTGAPYPVTATLCRSDGEYAVFRLSDGGDFFLSLRRCEAELETRRLSGTELPAEAIRTDGDGGSFVYIVSSLVVKRAEVDILYTDGTIALVSGIHAGETVAVSGRELREGMVIA